VSTAQTYKLEALTDIWTGDASGGPGRLIHTGLLGSIRWWFEVLVRGLGGSACDPSHRKDNKPGPCPPRGRKPHAPGHHCVVCELFGCTDWARKFRFDVLDANERVKVSQIKQNETVKFRFTELRPIRPEEWALLDLTLRLIADYGAIGGKTVYKPTEESSRQSEQHHQDFGLVEPVSSAPCRQLKVEDLRRYVSLPKWRGLNQGDFAWASLQNFWCVHGRCLSRQDADQSSFNRVLGRQESKKCRDCGDVHDPPRKCPKTKNHPRRRSDQKPTSNLEKWLAGGRAESKKVLSFKNPPRTFGFVKPGTITFGKILARLKDAWPDLKDSDFVRGRDVLARLLGSGVGGSL
jgi:CRISPR-associated protein Cmr1